MVGVGDGMLARKMLLAATCVGLPLAIGGCVADLFGDRALVYNQEAANGSDQAILTNIVRASLGRPLQFTQFTTVTGIASESLSLAGVIPFAVHRPTTVGAQATFMPSVGLSGGPNFTVVDLSTQEFYQGITSGIETQLLKYYLDQAGLSPTVLLPLLISDIFITTTSPTQPTIQTQTPGTVENFANFSEALEELIALGLNAEPDDKPTAESPALTETDAKDPKLLASLASGAAAGNTTLDLKRYEVADSITKNKDPNLVKSEYNNLKRNGNFIYFRLEKKSSKYRYCFSGETVEQARDALGLPELPLHYPIRIGKKTLLINIDKPDLCGSAPAPSASDTTQGTAQKVTENLKITTRSVQEIILFLGDIVRSGVPLDVYSTPQSGPGITVFSATEQPPAGPNVSATVDGRTYYVSVDATGQNMSSRVIQLVADLLALHSSAKNLPAPNVISVVP
jgi:hypothetical protein